MRLRTATATILVGAAVGAAVVGCGGSSPLQPSGSSRTTVVTVSSGSPTTGSGQKVGFPETATKNTTRVGGASAVQNAAWVALAVFPSAIPGTHPTAVTLAPENDWQASIAASSLMAGQIRAPVLLSRPGSMPGPTRAALGVLAPSGARVLAGTQVIRVGNVAAPSKLRSRQIPGNDPYTLAANIDRLETQASGKESVNVVIASATSPAYAMPAAGWAAESGDPILYVDAHSVPPVTVSDLLAHHHPHIYVLGPPSVIPDSIINQLRHYGTVKRVAGSDPAANSVAFATYRDPPCPSGQPCGHIPHSFGWAIRSPGHAYLLINASDPLDAAAASALSSSGGYGPMLLVENPNTLPKAVLNYFLDYATPGYTQQGPTAAVYNHGWLIGPPSAISVGVQAQVDSLLEAVPQK